MVLSDAAEFSIPQEYYYTSYSNSFLYDDFLFL